MNLSRWCGESKNNKSCKSSSWFKQIVMKLGSCHGDSWSQSWIQSMCREFARSWVFPTFLNSVLKACVLEVYLLVKEQPDNRWAATTVTLLAGFAVLAHILKTFQILSPWALCLAPALFYVFSAKKKEREEKQKKNHISMVTGRIKNASKHCKNARDVQMMASAGVEPGADRCTAYSDGEWASVWAHSQNNQLLWHQFTANNGAISSSPSLLPLSFSPLSLSLPPFPLCFRDEYITLPSPQHFILRWMFVKWNGKMSYSLILPPPSLPLSLPPSIPPSLSRSLPVFALHSTD